MFSGCNPDDFVRDNSRNIIEGSILNQDGLPLVNIPIVSAFDRNNLLNEQGTFEGLPSFPSDFDPILGESQSDDNGSFSFTSLVSVNSLRANYIHINNDENSLLHSVVYINDIPFEGSVQLPETILTPKAQLTLNIERTSSEPLSLFYNLMYENDREIIFLSQPTIDQTLFESGQLDLAQSTATLVISTRVGEELTFAYSIFNDDEVIENEVEIITINQPTQSFNFEF